MATATAAAIRDRVHTLVEALAPAAHNGIKFLRLRNEASGNIDEWAEKNPAACLRRFQARQVNTDDPPLVSDTTTERIILTLEMRVCYPQSGKFGSDNALDRDDAINQDWLKINKSVGMYGRANFSATHDCTPLPATMDMERGQGVDIMVVRLQFEFLRATT